MQARSAIVTALRSHAAQNFRSTEQNISDQRSDDSSLVNNGTNSMNRWPANGLLSPPPQEANIIIPNSTESTTTSEQLITKEAGCSGRDSPEPTEEYPLAVYPSMSSSASLSSRASKLSSSSALSVIAATLTSNAQIVGDGQTGPESGLDEFTFSLGEEEARLLVELLKLAVAERIQINNARYSFKIKFV